MSLPTKRHPSLLLLSTMGLGYLRPAPGTWGSMPPVVLAGLLLVLGFGPDSDAGRTPHWASSDWIVWNGVVALLGFLACVVCASLGDYGEAAFGKKDASSIVADETAGQCIPLLLLPAGALATPGLAAFTLVLAFLAFRVFDIVKIWPAHGLQRLSGGWGILMDDVVAGLQAMVLLQILTRAML